MFANFHARIVGSSNFRKIMSTSTVLRYWKKEQESMSCTTESFSAERWWISTRTCRDIFLWKFYKVCVQSYIFLGMLNIGSVQIRVYIYICKCTCMSPSRKLGSRNCFYEECKGKQLKQNEMKDDSLRRTHFNVWFF